MERDTAEKTPIATKLRQLLAEDRILTMPCCYDGLTARLVERAGFEVTFMTGFGVAAARGYPDTQLLSYEEMAQSARIVSSALKNIPCFGDGDTGYGNAMNIKRTVQGYAQAGMAGIMLEDQVSPKRCGHTKGKMVVSREEAFMRIQAAVDARNEGKDIVIIARTDARGTHSIEEAIYRCQEFVRIGADITFLEAPQSEDEMQRYCNEVPGMKLANMLEQGLTPILPPERLQQMGFKLAAYPLTLLGVSINSMTKALELLHPSNTLPGKRKRDEIDDLLAPFSQIKDVVGFNEYYEEEDRYKQGHVVLPAVEEETDEGFEPPKRNRKSFFDTNADAKRLRLDRTLRHEPVKGKRVMCSYCFVQSKFRTTDTPAHQLHSKTVYWCRVCKVPLCMKVRGDGDGEHCFHKWHTDKFLTEESNVDAHVQ